MDFPIYIVICLLVISLIVLIFLWRKKVSIYKKILWTLVILLPLVGPIFYGAFFEAPDVQPKHLRSNRERKNFHV